jgi:hypothetical protein
VPGKNCDDGTLVPDGTMVEISSDLGTMVINSDPEESTMKSENLNTKDGLVDYNLHVCSIRTRHKSGQTKVSASVFETFR